MANSEIKLLLAALEVSSLSACGRRYGLRRSRCTAILLSAAILASGNAACAACRYFTCWHGLGGIFVAAAGEAREYAAGCCQQSEGGRDLFH